MTERPRDPRRQRERQKAQAGGQHTGLIAGMVVLAVSVVVLIVVAMNAGASKAPATDPIFGDDATVAPTLPSLSPTAGPTQPAASATSQPQATATTGSGGVASIDCTDIMAPADKEHRMSPNCVPPGLRTVANSGQQMRDDAADALEEMFAAAAKENLSLVAVSGYRSYQTQESVYASAVQGYGQAEADRTSARPGFSEHQLGTVMDVSAPSLGGDLQESFGDTKEGRWVAENAHKFGFVISYPQGKEAITGYAFEPWHIRWFGPETAGKIKSSGLTTKEYLAKR